jgi:hypothetical protein
VAVSVQGRAQWPGSQPSTEAIPRLPRRPHGRRADTAGRAPDRHEPLGVQLDRLRAHRRRRVRAVMAGHGAVDLSLRPAAYRAPVRYRRVMNLAPDPCPFCAHDRPALVTIERVPPVYLVACPRVRRHRAKDRAGESPEGCGVRVEPAVWVLNVARWVEPCRSGWSSRAWADPVRPGRESPFVRNATDC